MAQQSRPCSFSSNRLTLEFPLLYAKIMNDNYIIRPARHGDRFAIGRLWHELILYHRSMDSRFVADEDAEKRYVRHAQQMMRSRDSRVLIGEETDTLRIFAYVIAEIQVRPPSALPGVYGFVSDIYVMPEWREHGIGKAMMSALRRWFIERRCSAIELYVAECNPRAKEFWEELGLNPFLTLMHCDL